MACCRRKWETEGEMNHLKPWCPGPVEKGDLLTGKLPTAPWEVSSFALFCPLEPSSSSSRSWRRRSCLSEIFSLWWELHAQGETKGELLLPL